MKQKAGQANTWIFFRRVVRNKKDGVVGRIPLQQTDSKRTGRNTVVIGGTGRETPLKETVSGRTHRERAARGSKSSVDLLTRASGVRVPQGPTKEPRV